MPYWFRGSREVRFSGTAPNQLMALAHVQKALTAHVQKTQTDSHTVNGSNNLSVDCQLMLFEFELRPLLIV